MSNDLTVSSGDYLALLKEMALNDKCDPAKMQAILDVQERVMNKAAIQAFDESMLRIDQELPRLIRDTPVEYLKEKNNPAAGKMTAFKYAKYEDIDEALRPLMKREGMRISFSSVPKTGDGGGALVTAKLSHTKGHSIEATMSAALDSSGGKSNLQGMGSTIAYCRRVLTCMLFNIVTIGEDKDGVEETEALTHEQAVEIDMLITSTKSDKPKFLAYMKVQDVQSIRAADYQKAMTALNAKKAKG